ncbi:hypothetical protein FA15DRAFT_659276 [Coprinopsis marcescibilis]|uniref:Uncharacterized protein n=1 Tax=Coprinopsis marcescibilis TaxID=230819 RepID=A0A5C3KJG8_COPMA|nr:hypothetical protein FA15DRAFT_659276 [Coprinopsis marcescibilis]
MKTDSILGKIVVKPVINPTKPDELVEAATTSSTQPPEPSVEDPNKGKTTNKEVEDWMSEGDHVEWFQAEAEIIQWQEEWELKLVELIQARTYYHKMAEIWASMADTKPEASTTPGQVAYACGMASCLKDQAKQTLAIMNQARHGSLGTEADLAVFIKAEHVQFDDECQKASFSSFANNKLNHQQQAQMLTASSIASDKLNAPTLSSIEKVKAHP